MRSVPSFRSAESLAPHGDGVPEVNDASLILEPDPETPGAVLLRLKAVPGASRSEIVGVLGDRLKVRVSEPPEAGRANEAIAVLIARTLGVHANDVRVISGGAGPAKTVRVRGVSVEAARARLGL